MKRFGNLYSEIAEIDNVRRAFDNAQRGKRHYTEVQRINADRERYVNDLYSMLQERRYSTSEYKIMTRNDTGKERTIYVLPFYPDRVVHHAVMQVLEPIWEKLLIRDTYSAIKGRGVHDGLRRIKEMLKDKEGTQYCLKMDVRKFYPNINHDIMKSLLRKKIKCEDALNLLDEIVDSAPGVPIGNYLSQYLGNLYLTYFDHWMKETVGAKYYARYCDDLVVFGSNKGWLHDVRERVDEYLYNQLRLGIKNNWQVFPTAVRGVDFLGYRFFGDKTLVRKSIAKRYKRRMREVARHVWPTCPNVVMSYKGWLKYAGAKGLWNSYADNNVMASVAAAKREAE